jgi:tetratricopeptide (TPR) repeat protein
MVCRVKLLSLIMFAASLHAESFLVLPFFNHSGAQNLDWIGESVAESIRDTLAAEGALTISREDRQEAYHRLSTRLYTQLTKASVIKIAETVDATHVIFGRFEMQPGTSATSRGMLRITAQIVDLKKIRSGPEFMAFGELEDLAALQAHIAWQSLQFLMPKTSPSEEEFRRRHVVIRVDAMEYYIRGLLENNEQQKHRFFTQAARLDPRFSPPCFELGRLHWASDNYPAAAEWFERVSASDSHYNEATFFKGASKFYMGDYAAAQAAFETVVRLVPLNEVHNNLGAAQSRRNLPEAVESFQKALEGDPNDYVYLFNLGYAFYKRGDFDAAAKQFRAVLQRDPEDQQATVLLGRSLQKSAARPGDPKTDNLDRLKHEFNESAFLQLRAILDAGKK